jgi:hypothetical protein
MLSLLTLFPDILTDCHYHLTPVDCARASARFRCTVLASMAPLCRDLRRRFADVVLNTWKILEVLYLLWLFLPLLADCGQKPLLVVLLISYIPQILRIYSKGTTCGISLYYVAFAFLFTTCQLSNFLYLQCTRFPVLWCISEGPFFQA